VSRGARQTRGYHPRSAQEGAQARQRLSWARQHRLSGPIEKVEKALRYAYRDRRNRKRDFRALWIQRINAGAREHGLTYSQFMHGIKLAGLGLDRKVLSDLAIREPEAFEAIAATARSALAAPPSTATAAG
jgi:large subunit ribosomal protein L20